MVEISDSANTSNNSVDTHQLKNFTRYNEKEEMLLSVDFTLDQALDPRRWDEVQIAKLFVSTKKRA